MEQKNLIFSKHCINKNKLHKNKRPININRVEIKWVVLSKNDSHGKQSSLKYLIRYINETNALPIPLCIKLPQINGYIKYFDRNNKYINFLAHDQELKNYWLYVLIMSRMHLRVHPYSIVAWISRNSLLEAGRKSKV